MRSMCDDQKNKTDQALLTAPVGVTAIVLGKFFACCFVYFVATTLGGILPAIVMSTFSTPSWGEIIGNYIGALLYGAAMISIGVFISSLTVSQIIAAIGTFIISVLLMYMDSLASVVSNEVLSTAIQWFSFNDRYSTFTQGMFSISSVISLSALSPCLSFSPPQGGEPPLELRRKTNYGNQTDRSKAERGQKAGPQKGEEPLSLQQI